MMDQPYRMGQAHDAVPGRELQIATSLQGLHLALDLLEKDVSLLEERLSPAMAYYDNSKVPPNMQAEAHKQTPVCRLAEEVQAAIRRIETTRMMLGQYVSRLEF
jgi:hypothetical protein